jgi:hypothetical protein
MPLYIPLFRVFIFSREEGKRRGYPREDLGKYYWQSLNGKV